MKTKDKGHSTESSGDHRLTWNDTTMAQKSTTHDGATKQSNKYAEAAVLKMGCFQCSRSHILTEF